jgi:hypothetical protein
MELSLNDMPVHDHHQDWSDEHITVKYAGFDQATGVASFKVIEHHNNVGVYYIRVIHGPDGGPSGGPPSHHQEEYDGGNPRREKYINVQTGQRQDRVRGIKVKRIRD